MINIAGDAVLRKVPTGRVSRLDDGIFSVDGHDPCIWLAAGVDKGTSPSFLFEICGALSGALHEVIHLITRTKAIVALDQKETVVFREKARA